MKKILPLFFKNKVILWLWQHTKMWKRVTSAAFLFFTSFVMWQFFWPLHLCSLIFCVLPRALCRTKLNPSDAFLVTFGHFLKPTANMDSENKAVHILPRKPPAERAVSLGWIITFHADDNRGISALHCSSVLRSSTLLLNCEQNGSYWLLQFCQRWPLSCLMFDLPFTCWTWKMLLRKCTHWTTYKCSATTDNELETSNLKVTCPRRFSRVLLKNETK